jgi:hypothetical protein
MLCVTTDVALTIDWKHKSIDAWQRTMDVRGSS